MRIKTKKRGGGGRGIFFIASVLLAAGGAVYGQDLVPQGMMTLAENIRDVFTGDLAKIIMGCCFAGSCIAYGYNKDNEKMKNKVLAVIIATGLLIISQQIIDKLWTSN